MAQYLFRTHTLDVTDLDGVTRTRRVTCATADERHNANHLRTVRYGEDDGSGLVEFEEILDCHDAEAERQRLLARTAALKAEITQIEAAHAADLAARDEREGQKDQKINELTVQLVNDQRLMANAMLIVFHLRSKLQDLLGEELDNPDLTDDQTAIRLVNVRFTVILLPFAEKIFVRDVTGIVSELELDLPGGQLSDTRQTLLLGHVERIKKAAEDGGRDPVAADGINLVAASVTN